MFNLDKANKKCMDFRCEWLKSETLIIVSSLCSPPQCGPVILIYQKPQNFLFQTFIKVVPSAWNSHSNSVSRPSSPFSPEGSPPSQGSVLAPHTPATLLCKQPHLLTYPAPCTTEATWEKVCSLSSRAQPCLGTSRSNRDALIKLAN